MTEASYRLDLKWSIINRSKVKYFEVKNFQEKSIQLWILGKCGSYCMDKQIRLVIKDAIMDECAAKFTIFCSKGPRFWEYNDSLEQFVCYFLKRKTIYSLQWNQSHRVRIKKTSVGTWRQRFEKNDWKGKIKKKTRIAHAIRLMPVTKFIFHFFLILCCFQSCILFCIFRSLFSSNP